MGHYSRIDLSKNVYNFFEDVNGKITVIEFVIYIKRCFQGIFASTETTVSHWKLKLPIKCKK